MTGAAGGSWPSLTNSVTAGRGPNAVDLPLPSERVEELIEERPELARTPVASEGTKVREEVVETVRECPKCGGSGRLDTGYGYRTCGTCDGMGEVERVPVVDRVRGSDPDGFCDKCDGSGECSECGGTGCAECRGGECRTCGGSGDLWEPMGVPVAPNVDPDYRPVTVAEALYAFLADYEESRGSRVYLEKRTADGEMLDFAEKSAENSFAGSYRRKRYGQLMGFEREIPAAFEEPVVALLGLTASGTDADGRPRPPADHMREIAETWSKSGGVRETLRNQLESRLGLDPDEWAYIRGGEPHPGDGANRGYHHDHPAVVLDAAAADGEPGPETFRPVVEKHVAECPTAEPEAHRLDDVVTVREVDEEKGVGSVGSYVGAYVAADVDSDLLEEPLRYLVWAATTWATTTQKFTAGRTARAMIDADRCRSEAEAGRHGPHGARLHLTTDAWGRETVECAYCGSHHDVPETYTEARHARAETRRIEEPVAGSEESPESAVGLWPSAAGAAAYDADGVRETVEYAKPPPEWYAVELRRGDGEVFEIGTPGSVTYHRINDAPADPEVVYRRRVARLRESFEEGQKPADMRKAVIDALRDMAGPATAADVAEHVPTLDEETAGEYLQKFKTEGRVIPSAGGYLPAD